MPCERNWKGWGSSMRNSDMQMQEILARAERIKDKRILKNRIAADAAAGGICLLLTAVVGAMIPRLKEAAADRVGGAYGSLILGTPYLGYILIGILGFALGVCLTLLGIHIRRLKGRGSK